MTLANGESMWAAMGNTPRRVRNLPDERQAAFAFAEQVGVDRVGDLAPFGDGPHHEALAARHVAGGEHAVDAGARRWSF